MNGSKLAFGLRLRAHRERRGISHETLAGSLKIKCSLLKDLERGDVSRWPGGIYRRALFREYVKAVGLPAAESLEEFCELFAETPESHPVISAGNAPVRNNGTALRLTLAKRPTPTQGVVYRRLANAAADLVLVLVLGYAVTLLTELPYWTTSGVVALVWYPATAVFGDRHWHRMVPNARLRRTLSPLESPPNGIVNSICGHPPTTDWQLGRESVDGQ